MQNGAFYFRKEFEWEWPHLAFVPLHIFPAVDGWDGLRGWSSDSKKNKGKVV